MFLAIFSPSFYSWNEWNVRHFSSSQAQELNLVPNFSRQFENFEIYKDLYGKLFKRDWVAKVNTVVKISQDTTHLIVQLDIRISYYLRSSENF